MVRHCTKAAVSEAFTLIEVLVAGGVTALLAVVLFAFVSQTQDGVRMSRSSVDEFQQAQRAFEVLAQRIGQATLNNYREAVLIGDELQPDQRMSDLRFVCGPMQCGTDPLDADLAKTRPGHGVFFQAASGRPGAARDPALAGLENLVNTWGYFVETGPDNRWPPAFLPPSTAGPRIAPRLMEMCEPTERLGIYGHTSGHPEYAGFEWFRTPLANPGLVRVAAENIALLLVVPRLPAKEAERLAPGATSEQVDALLAPQLFYHSGAPTPPHTDPERNMRHRLPATVELTMVALDPATVAGLYHADALDPFNLRDAFHDALELRGELEIDRGNPGRDSLERRLIAARAHHRFFTTVVPIRSAQ